MFREKNVLSHVLITDQLRLYIFIAINLLISDILLCLHVTRLIVSTASTIASFPAHLMTLALFSPHPDFSPYNATKHIYHAVKQFGIGLMQDKSSGLYIMFI